MFKSSIFSLFNKQKSIKSKLENILSETGQKIVTLRQATAQAIASQDHMEQLIEKNIIRSEDILKAARKQKYKEPDEYDKAVKKSEEYLKANEDLNESFEELSKSAGELRRVLAYFEELVNRTSLLIKLILIFNEYLEMKPEITHCHNIAFKYCKKFLIYEDFVSVEHPHEELDELERRVLESIRTIEIKNLAQKTKEKFFEDLEELQDEVLVKHTKNSNEFEKWKKYMSNIADIDENEKRKGETVRELRIRANENLKHFETLMNKEKIIADFIDEVRHKTES